MSDKSGNGNNGTIHGNPTFVEGIKGQAIKFDGIDDWVELTDFSVPESFTISMLVNPYTTDDEQAFIGKHSSSGENIFLLGYWGGGCQERIRIDYYTSGTKTTGYQHLVLVTDKINDTQSELKLYKDGNLMWSNIIDSVVGDTTGKSWVLAQEWDGSTLGDFFNGEIDELFIYNTVLSESDIININGENNVQTEFNGNSKSNSKTIVYNYDKGGNITSKTEYNYSKGIFLPTKRTYDYTYGDANWKDKLTNFDGKAITYDAIGNPLTYDGWTFDWEQGRQLKSMNVRTWGQTLGENW
ncbi:LamG domain-containing protein [Clostridium grantii]|uniref:Concanavalin A-like lectin/glucanases superfamily protein n=1 Tax=Clostridium grantii DSM 8605 TaxID=1121316 RepID=A0A1M5Y7V1_9CLOT|nr:LamG domain-containing protein [Clostridium grantii]SHI08052.1 Concanavalin A-like lectin/glucanases superfamily protein [Clostridium grantii DSM 8605]